jgi:hypothetical protein
MTDVLELKRRVERLEQRFAELLVKLKSLCDSST